MLNLLKKLSLEFGPTGYEKPVREMIIKELEPYRSHFEAYVDKLGAYIVRFKNEGAPKLMISAHMDEVGMMITDICDDGRLRFGTVGGIVPLVLLSKRVISENGVIGSIISKPVHLQSDSERKEAPKIKDLYIDIGADTKAEAEALCQKGDLFTFISDYVEFGENKKLIKCKALDDRLGCAIMCQAIKDLCSEGVKPSVDLYFAFTCREEVGYSGAFCASEQIHPDYAFIIESTAVGDAYSSDSESTVASLGNGGAISFADRGTIYDRAFTEKLISVCKDKCIDYQMKKYVSGGNDSSHIQRSGFGVKVAVMSAPSRYIHSASCVIHKNDVESIYKALYYLIADWGK